MLCCMYYIKMPIGRIEQDEKLRYSSRSQIGMYVLLQVVIEIFSLEFH